MACRDSLNSARKGLLFLVATSVVASCSVVTAFQSLHKTRVAERSTANFAHGMIPFDRQAFNDGGDKGRRIAEFLNLEPVTESEARRARLERDQETKERFAEYGDELWKLRKKMKKLGDKLVGALNGGSKDSEELIRSDLRDAEARDPELVYEMELLEMELAKRAGDITQMEKSKQRALSVRSLLPHLNLDGLWVGKYVGNDVA